VLNKEKEEVISKTAFVQTIQEMKDNLKYANRKVSMLQNAKDKVREKNFLILHKKNYMK